MGAKVRIESWPVQSEGTYAHHHNGERLIRRAVYLLHRTCTGHAAVVQYAICTKPRLSNLHLDCCQFFRTGNGWYLEAIPRLPVCRALAINFVKRRIDQDLPH